MIIGNGIDIVAIDRMEQALANHHDAFAEKILSSKELEEFSQRNNKAVFLAKRFAAKEAFLKALGTGLRDGISLKHLSVTHDTLGKPLLSCESRAAEILQHQSVDTIHLSISDEKAYAIAMVILETNN